MPRNHIRIVTIVNMQTIADRLRFSRSAKGWTQAQLAVAASVSTGTIGNIESGARQSKGSLPQIAEALGVSHKWLATGEGRMELSAESAATPYPILHAPAQLADAIDLQIGRAHV